MLRNRIRSITVFLLIAALALSLSACTSDDAGKPNQNAATTKAPVVNAPVPESNQFTWWIDQDDSQGTYYSKYEENPAIQWLNNQYWDLGNHSLGAAENGQKLKLSFVVPVAGAQRDNFNTMLSTQTYPEILSLNMSDQSALTLAEEGVLIEITEYIEKYAPNYKNFFDQNPRMKKFGCVTDDDGHDHYYQLMEITDAQIMPWNGYGYRRDWVVKYAIPTEYVWDLDSDTVKANGHPDVTPLANAVAQDNLSGWKRNPVTAFESSEGDDPDETYTDNVIFPSGGADPYTISDWEWMLEAFSKALEERGFAGNSNAYCMTLMYYGYSVLGDLNSSFGGGNGGWALNDDGQAMFTGTGDNFKAYLECMNTWYQNGWLDTRFETRSSDLFFEINPVGFNQGMVGMSETMIISIGSLIRATCVNEEDRRDAMVFGCALPVNDVYGGDAQKFHDPDCQFQIAKANSPVGFTTKCEDKNMEALFTMFNWMYSEEGDPFTFGGLSEEQYKSMTFEPDLYARLGVPAGYIITTAEDGTRTVRNTVLPSDPAANAIRSARISTHFNSGVLQMHSLHLDMGNSRVKEHAVTQWMAYEAKNSLYDYAAIFSSTDSQAYAKTNNYITDLMSQEVPGMIKNGLSGWDTFVKKINKFGPDKISAIYQKYVD